MSDRQSRRAVLRALLAGVPPVELFDRVRSAGVEPSAAMDIVARYDELFDPEDVVQIEGPYGGTDWILALVEAYGLDEAARVAARTTCWANVDVTRHHAAASARRRAHGAITDEAPIQEAYAACMAPEVDEHERRTLLWRMARVYSLDELASLDALPDAHAAVIGAVLTAALSAAEAFDELIGEVEDDRVLAVLRRFWRIETPLEGAAGIVDCAARVCVDAFRPVSAVIPVAEARGEPGFWLPILRAYGLKGSLAMLPLLERGWRPLPVAGLLADAGYGDEEVLAALLENGINHTVSLDLLRAGGWSFERMVASLAMRGVLLPEVREHLARLDVPRHVQRVLLTPHWPEPLVDLILGQHALRLTSGD